jgi:hypothetical protein
MPLIWGRGPDQGRPDGQPRAGEGARLGTTPLCPYIAPRALKAHGATAGGMRVEYKKPLVWPREGTRPGAGVTGKPSRNEISYIQANLGGFRGPPNRSGISPRPAGPRLGQHIERAVRLAGAAERLSVEPLFAPVAPVAGVLNCP